MKFRFRPLVFTVALYAAILVGVFGWLLLSDAETALDTQALGLLFGAGIGGLMTLAGQLVVEPASGNVPAGVHSRVLAMVRGTTVEAKPDDASPFPLTVIILATLAALLTLIFGLMMIARLDQSLNPITLVAILIGIGVGGLLTLAGKLASEDPPPTVPASTYEDDIGLLLKK